MKTDTNAKKHNICPVCNSNFLTSKNQCCIAARRDYNNAYNQERKKDNICPGCGKKAGINPKTGRYYTLCDTCRKKRREYNRRPEVKEKLKETFAKYKLTKKEERDEYNREYRLKNKEKIAEYCREYYIRKKQSKAIDTNELPENPRLSPKTCTCGTTFLGGPTAKYCPVCRAERIRQRDRAKHQRKRAGAVRSLGSTDLCVLCGKPYTVNAGLQKYCPECSVAEDKRRQNESWQRGYYGNPEKRRQMIERARQWAENNKGRLSEILRKNYEKTKETRNENRRKRTGYKLRPLGRTETCPKCQKPFTVTNRNQKYCGDHSRP